MSTLLYTPNASAHDSHAELAWLLTALHDPLISLKSGLQECSDLLAPREPGATLVLSSRRSEHLKGFVTRVGSRIVKGEIHLRVPSLPPPKGQSTYKLSVSSLPSAPALGIPQLISARTSVNAALDLIDATQWTGNRNDAGFVSGQLRLLHECVSEAKEALKGDATAESTPADSVDPTTFTPPLPSRVALNFSITDAAVILNVRVSDHGFGEDSLSGFSIRERLATAWGGSQRGSPQGGSQMQSVDGDEPDLRVRDKVRVESLDPNLMAALAKLVSLERSVDTWRRALDVVMRDV
ncbi:hypothetical protein K470DRAFT_211624 [Piedraia hortae CBS 480.64]|uniref:RAVE subunit 2/Rogdi n=1 Tax=Piedraia hortae CBS 480.64 TaxID=1314780 RepID=A0A6A7C621_9PEZI|nr:hypothetical protein K470DRAFT_211624 [Piedraia hortae CBS 480.64]